MKKLNLFVLLALIICLVSCSQVFEAGVSGKLVTEVDGTEQGVADVYVYSYTDKDLYEKDLTKFRKGEITRPSEGYYIPATTTAQNGEFTISRIVWETKDGMFGKTADVVDLYLIFYHPDFEPCGFGPVSVISGSTNSSSVKQTINQLRFSMPVLSSQISLQTDENNKTTTGDDTALDKFDNQSLILTDSEFHVYEGAGAAVYTYKTEHGVDTLTYSHGHFSGLGAGLKWEFPNEETKKITVNIVWDKNDNGLADVGEYYYPVTVSRSTTSIPSRITFTSVK